MTITELQKMVSGQMAPSEVLKLMDNQGYDVNNTSALWSDVPPGWSGSLLTDSGDNYIWDLTKQDKDWIFQATKVDS